MRFMRSLTCQTIGTVLGAVSVLGGSLTGMAYMIMKKAGPLLFTVLNMDNCDRLGNSLASDCVGANCLTVSVDQLKQMDPSATWPNVPVYGCIDGLQYGPWSVSALLTRAQILGVNCISILTDANWSASKNIPYSPKGEYVNALGAYCAADTNSLVMVGFFVTTAVALSVVGFGAYRFFCRQSDTETQTAIGAPLVDNHAGAAPPVAIGIPLAGNAALGNGVYGALNG